MRKNIWDILGIEATTDKKAIKRVFARKVKTLRPEDDPTAYQQLREAYEQATAYATTQPGASEPHEPHPLEPRRGRFQEYPRADLTEVPEPTQELPPPTPQEEAEPEVNRHEEVVPEVNQQEEEPAALLLKEELMPPPPHEEEPAALLLKEEIQPPVLEDSEENEGQNLSWHEEPPTPEAWNWSEDTEAPDAFEYVHALLELLHENEQKAAYDQFMELKASALWKNELFKEDFEHLLFSGLLETLWPIEPLWFTTHIGNAFNWTNQEHSYLSQSWEQNTFAQHVRKLQEEQRADFFDNFARAVHYLTGPYRPILFHLLWRSCMFHNIQYILEMMENEQRGLLDDFKETQSYQWWANRTQEPFFNTVSIFSLLLVGVNLLLMLAIGFTSGLLGLIIFWYPCKQAVFYFKKFIMKRSLIREWPEVDESGADLQE